jgi:hypothetical protein
MCSGKLSQVTSDLACKPTVYCATETIIRITRRKTLERWETKVGNCEVTPQAVAHCEIVNEKEWAKDTNHCSWPFRSNISLELESEGNCELFRKRFHIS